MLNKVVNHNLEAVDSRYFGIRNPSVIIFVLDIKASII